MTSKNQSELLEEKRARLAEALRRKARTPISAPLSFGQKRLWFVDQLDPGSPLYNITFSFRATGDLKLKVLEQVIDELVVRHEPLRTTFGVVDGEPVQLIAPPYKTVFDVIDIADAPGDSHDDKIERYVRHQNNIRFNLQTGPLHRLSFLRIASDEYIGCFTLHHIISDGWSIGVVLLEITAAYPPLSQGQPVSLPKLPIRYRDYAKWQQETLQGEKLDRLLSHWTRRLDGACQFLSLPTDRPRPEKLTHNGTVFRFHLKPQLFRALTALSQQHGTTLFATLLAGYASLLHRYTDQSDMLIGIPIAGRDRPETQPLVGYFVNILPERIEFHDNPSFSKLLDRIRESTIESFANQDVPFEKLVEALQPKRSLDRNPLVQVVYLYQNFPLPDEYDSFGFGLEMLEIHPGFSRFELGLRTEQGELGIDCLLEYNTDLFDESTIERFSIHLRQLLEHVVKDPQQRVKSIDILPKSERQLLIESFNNTTKELGPDKTIHELFELQAHRLPDQVAIRCGGSVKITFRQLSDWSNQLAARLRAAGMKPGQRVAVVCAPAAEMVAAILGVLKTGGAFVLQNPIEFNQWTERQFAEASPEFYLVSDSILSLVADRPSTEMPWQSPNCTAIVIDASDPIDNPTPGDRTKSNEPIANPRDVACVSFATVGQRRAVEIEHRNLVASIRAAIDQLDVGQNEKFAVCYSSTDFACVAALLTPLLAGAQLCICSKENFSEVPPERLTDSEHGSDSASRFELLHIAPADLDRLLDRGLGANFPWLPARLLVLSGQVISWKLIDRLHERAPNLPVFCQFGFAETAGGGLCFPIPTNERSAGDRTDLYVPLGRPNPNVSSYVLDSEGQPAPLGVAGQLCLSGACVARGYLGSTGDLTASKEVGFTQNPFSPKSGERLFRTGEKARVRPNGNIEHLGRCDERIRLNNAVVDPGEIEVALQAHDAVDKCVVFQYTNDIADSARENAPHQLVAYVVPASSAAPTDHQLRDFLSTKVPGHMVPAAFELLERLPLASDGTVDRHELPRPRKSRTGVSKTPAVTATEKLLVELWQQVLGLEEVGIHDDFFALGGNSLLAMQLVQSMRQRIGAHLPLGLIFEKPTIVNIASLFDQSMDGKNSLGQVVIPAVPRDQSLPLSHSQYLLWLVEQFEQGIAFNAPLGFRLDGPLVVDGLLKSLNEISNRHSILRASIQIENGQPVHAIGQSQGVSFEFKDLTQIPKEQREPESLKLAKLLTQQPFELSKGSLVRYLLVKMDSEQHLLFVAIHHIVSDGWSFAVMMQELVQLYQAFVEGKPSPLPELAIQFTDYAHWQRNTTNEQAKIQSRYWLETLGTSPPVLDLPTDFARGKSIAVEPDVCDLVIPPEIIGALSEIGRQEGSTLYMTILAAYMILLQRYASQNDFIVGSAMANRPHPQTHELIGFFATLLPIRCDLSGEPTFLEVLDQVRRRSGEAIARPEPDLEQLVPIMRPPGLGRMPLCQALFTFAEFPDEPILAGGVNWTPVDLNIVRVSGFDLVLTLGRSGEALSGAFLYRPDLFHLGTIERWREGFVELLRGIIRNPAARISRLPVITASERQRMLGQWNDTDAAFPQDFCVHELFEQQVARVPEATAVIDANSETSFQQLDCLANGIAGRLQQLQVETDNIVAVLVPRSAEMVAALLGIMKAGAAYLPLDPSWPIGRMTNILKNAQCRVIVTTPSQIDTVVEVRNQLRATLQIVNVKHLQGDSVTGELSDQRDAAEVAAFRPEKAVVPSDLAYVIFTSGSTGPPKGVMVEHTSVVNVIHSFATTYKLGPDDRVLQQASVAFDVSVNEIFPVLTAGGTLVIPPPDSAADFDAIAEFVEQQKITIMAATPSGLTELNRRAENLQKVRLVLSGGEALAESHVDKLVKFATVTNGYGPTETTVCATFFDLNRMEQTGAGTIPIGKPLPNYRVYIVDQELKLVPIGCPGELCIAGIGLARGYLGDPELTASKFVDNPFEPGQRLYLTGDEARWLADGNIEFLGRIDRQIKIRGFRVELGEIETALQQREDISQVVVICDHDATGNQRIVAYVSTRDPVPESKKYSIELREFLLARLPDHMVPSVFMFVDEIPLTSNGKVDLNSLPKPVAQRPHLEMPFVAPRNAAEETMAEIWREALSLDRIGVDDNFFELGGHSLLAAQIMHRVQQQFEIVFPYRLFFDSQTVAKTAQLVEQIRQHGIESLPEYPGTQATQVDGVATTSGHRSTPPAEAAAGRVSVNEHESQQRDRSFDKLQAESKGYFGADAAARKKWEFSQDLQSTLVNDGHQVREAVWRAFVESQSLSPHRNDFDADRVRFENYQSPYTVKQVGTRPESGWPLFIALHGGGGTTSQINDHQWKVMQSYYHDQPHLGGYKYLALRAPTDAWNGFYDDFVYPLVENLIRQFAVFGDIDTNKVFLIGYSHGGYGAFTIGPKLPHRFAAIHSSAAAPVDGETAAETLRSTRFTYMIGENEHPSTLRRCDRFAEQVEQLRIQNPDQYPVEMLIKQRHGHAGLPDRDMIDGMYRFYRQPVPEHVTWRMTDSVVKDFFWLSTDQPGKQKRVDAQLVNNRLLIETENVDQITVWLNEGMVDFGKPLRVFVNKTEREPQNIQPTFKTLCDSLLRTGDPHLAFEARIDISTSSPQAEMAVQETASKESPKS